MITKAYGLLTVLPSEPSEDGNAKTIIFSGITSAGPQAGLEFFRSPRGPTNVGIEVTERGISEIPTGLPSGCAVRSRSQFGIELGIRDSPGDEGVSSITLTQTKPRFLIDR